MQFIGGKSDAGFDYCILGLMMILRSVFVERFLLDQRQAHGGDVILRELRGTARLEGGSNCIPMM